MGADYGSAGRGRLLELDAGPGVDGVLEDDAQVVEREAVVGGEAVEGDAVGRGDVEGLAEQDGLLGGAQVDGLALAPAACAHGLHGLRVRKTVWFMLHAQTDEQGRMWVQRRPRDKANADAPLGSTGGYEFFDEDDPPDPELWDDTGPGA